jgi:hypothetical protein
MKPEAGEREVDAYSAMFWAVFCMFLPQIVLTVLLGIAVILFLIL